MLSSFTAWFDSVLLAADLLAPYELDLDFRYAAMRAMFPLTASLSA